MEEEKQKVDEEIRETTLTETLSLYHEHLSKSISVQTDKDSRRSQQPGWQIPSGLSTAVGRLSRHAKENTRITLFYLPFASYA